MKTLFKLSLRVILFIAFFSELGTCQISPTKEISINGEKLINEDFVVQLNETLVIEPGSKLKIGNNVKISVFGKIVAKGTKEKPIVFEGAGANEGDNIYWRGIEIKGLDDAPDIKEYWRWIELGDKNLEDSFFNKIQNGNIFEYCLFKDLAANKTRTFQRKNKWKGTIEAYNTSIRVSNCTFKNILYFGGVLTQKSYVMVDNCLFDDNTLHKAINSTDNAVGIFYNNTIIGHRLKNHRCADGIWTKSFTGLIASNKIDSVADDGLDIASSYTVIFDNKISNNWDDGIDIDNIGLAYILNNNISNVSKENGILISSQANAVLVNNTIANSNNGLTVRGGAEAVANEMKIINNKVGVLVLQHIPCALTNSDFVKVKEQLLKYTPEEISEEQYISDVNTAQDLIKIIDSAYILSNGYWIFKEKDSSSVSKFDDLKKVFKFVNVLDLEYVTNEETESHFFCNMLKNSLYITGSELKNNVQEVSANHNYRMRIDDTEFTNEEIKKSVLGKCKCESNYKCKLIDKLNTTAVEVNARKIIQRIIEGTRLSPLGE